MMRIGHALGIAAFALALALPAWAQDTVRVRGTIEQVDGNNLTVKSRDGADLKVALAPNALAMPPSSLTCRATRASSSRERRFSSPLRKSCRTGRSRLQG